MYIHIAITCNYVCNYMYVGIVLYNTIHMVSRCSVDLGMLHVTLLHLLALYPSPSLLLSAEAKEAWKRADELFFYYFLI